MELSIRNVGGAQTRKRLEHIIRNMDKLPEARQVELERIIGTGLRDTFHTLSQGGDVTLPNGSSYKWTMVRSSFTRRVRMWALGYSYRYMPLLSFTGKLEGNLFRGSFRVGTRQILYRPPSAIADLVRVHQLGLAPLPDRRGSPQHISKVPQRIMLTWTRRMVDQAVDVGRDHLKDGMKS